MFLRGTVFSKLFHSFCCFVFLGFLRCSSGAFEGFSLRFFSEVFDRRAELPVVLLVACRGFPKEAAEGYWSFFFVL